MDDIIHFMQETEKLKSVMRSVPLSTGDRKESSAEHSWHLAILLMLLQKEAPIGLDFLRTLRMLLTHDLVEVYAGDTRLYDTLVVVPCMAGGTVLQYDEDKVANKKKCEQAAAAKLFSLLPADLCEEFSDLFREFEARETLEAKFAKALDKLHPLLQSSVTDGQDYRECGSTYSGEMQLLQDHFDCLPEKPRDFLWAMARKLLDDAKNKGWLVEVPL